MSKYTWKQPKESRNLHVFKEDTIPFPIIFMNTECGLLFMEEELEKRNKAKIKCKICKQNIGEK